MSHQVVEQAIHVHGESGGGGGGAKALRKRPGNAQLDAHQAGGPFALALRALCLAQLLGAVEARCARTAAASSHRASVASFR